MAVCASVVTLGTGEQVLALDPSIVDVGACSFVVQSGSDVISALPALNSIDGTALSYAVISVWAIAWGFKMAVRTLGSSKNASE
jgi:hypothetical protein